MRTHTLHIFTRFLYDPTMVDAHGTPLFDRKQSRHVRPTSTVRVDSTYFTPKQLVYILNHPDAAPTPDNGNPFFALPAFILNHDGDATNIAYPNLRAATSSRRWSQTQYVEARNGALIPKHLMAMMSEEDMRRAGVHSDDNDYDYDYDYQ